MHSVNRSEFQISLVLKIIEKYFDIRFFDGSNVLSSDCITNIGFVHIAIISEGVVSDPSFQFFPDGIGIIYRS